MTSRDNYPIGPEGEAINHREAGNRENARRARLAAAGDPPLPRDAVMINGRIVQYPLPPSSGGAS